MSDQIIVGVTDAAASRRAVDWAVQRAAEAGQSVLLFSVSDERPDAEAVPVAQLVLEAEAARVAAFAAAHGLTVEVEVRAEHGNAVDRLIAASEDAPLLVIGSDHLAGHRSEHGRRIVAGAHSAVAVIPDVDTAGRTGVVVGIDGSEVTDAAVAFAAEEAVRRGEPLTAVAAWLPVPLSGDPGMTGIGYVDVYPVDLEEPTRGLAERALEATRAAHPDLAIETVVEEADPADLLNETAKDAAVLVVGTHGRGRLARFLLGSVSDAVVTAPTAPTIVIR